MTMYDERSGQPFHENGHRPRSRGMLPGESMKYGVVPVYDENPMEGKPTGRGIERRPDFYVPILRRLDGRWQLEVLKAEPITDGLIPHEVFERVFQYRQRIIHEQRSDRAKESAALRKQDVITPEDLSDFEASLRGEGWETVSEGKGRSILDDDGNIMELEVEIDGRRVRIPYEPNGPTEGDDWSLT